MAEPTPFSGIPKGPSQMLDRDEYVEQAYFFRALRERLGEGYSTQELIRMIRHEILSTTQLPYALDCMVDELRHTGGFASVMSRLSHYFTPFQAYVMSEAERDSGRMEFATALEILEKEAEYRAKGANVQGIFLYQFETLCRNRLGYDKGLAAMAGDPVYDDAWREWLDTVRRQIGLVDIADMIFVRSEYYVQKFGPIEKPVLFGLKEGQIAAANRRKDALYLFAALARHLGYPTVPRTRKADDPLGTLYALRRRVERLETRLKLVEEEQRGGIDLSRFFIPDEKKGK